MNVLIQTWHLKPWDKVKITENCLEPQIYEFIKMDWMYWQWKDWTWSIVIGNFKNLKKDWDYYIPDNINQ